MSQLVPFESAQLPAFLKDAGAINSDLTTNVGSGGFPVLSIKGKVFALVKNQERKIIMRPDDDDEPATKLEVVLLKANPALSKVFYLKEFEDGEMGKPDCFSNDGVRPDAEVKEPQCKTCAACPHNVFGSGRNGKGKACSDARRIALAPAGQLNEPMLLRVPPATLKPLAEYGKMLNNRGVPYSAVVTRIRFEREEATPKLIFEPVRFLTEAEFAEVQEMVQSEIVETILGSGAPVPHDDKPAIAGTPPAAAKPAKQSKVTDEELDAVAKPAEEAIKKAKAATAEAAEEKPKKKAAALDDDLDGLLAGLDD